MVPLDLAPGHALDKPAVGLPRRTGSDFLMSLTFLTRATASSLLSHDQPAADFQIEIGHQQIAGDALRQRVVDVMSDSSR